MLQLKYCSQCGGGKSSGEFYNDRHSSDGKCSACKDCMAERNNARYMQYSESDVKQCHTCQAIKQLREFSKGPTKYGRASNCKMCDAARKKADHDANPHKRQSAVLKKKFGMTLDDYHWMLEGQLGQCGNPGCQNIPDPDRRRFPVDHDRNCCPGEHSCGKCIRGVLCPGCNTALGLLGEDPKRLQGLIDYHDGG